MLCCAFIITGNRIKKTVIIVLRTSIFDLRKKTMHSVRCQITGGTRCQDDIMKKNFKEIYTRFVMLALAPLIIHRKEYCKKWAKIWRDVLVTDESHLTPSFWMFSIIYILKFPTFFKNLCKHYCSQLRRRKFLWKIYFKMLSWFDLAIPISYATSSTFSFLHNILRSLKRNFDDFQIYLLDELQYRFNVIGVWLRLRQLTIIRKFQAIRLNMSRRP